MDIPTIIRSAIQGGSVSYVLSSLVILECAVSTFICIFETPEKIEELKTHLRVSSLLVLILINGLNNCSFLLVIFNPRIQKAIFVCWSVHTFGFVIFFLNIIQNEELFETINFADLIFRIVFYAILISNSLFFMIFMMFSILVSLFVISCPNLVRRFPRLANFSDNFMNEFRMMEEPTDPRYQPLDETELIEMKSQCFELRNSELTCLICLTEMQEKDKVLIMPICKHVFHSECIKKWLRSKPECPTCRRNVRNGDGMLVVD